LAGKFSCEGPYGHVRTVAFCKSNRNSTASPLIPPALKLRSMNLARRNEDISSSVEHRVP
jgi:hypothetical protein